MSQNEALAQAIDPVVDAIAAQVRLDAPTWYAINQKEGSDEAEISIYDAIGAWGISADRFVGELKRLAGTKRINLRLNTPGGEIFDGTAIYNVLRAFPAEVIVHIDGVAASAGSFIAMSGAEVRMADNAYLMIHNARGGVMGEADDMRRYADLLEKCNDNIAGMYQRKAGKTRKHWRNLMDVETWFTAAEAKAEGLIDTIVKSEKPAAPAKADFDFAVYNKIPEPVRRLWGISHPVTNSTHTAALESEAAPGLASASADRKASDMSDTSIQSPPAQAPAAVNSGVPQDSIAGQTARLTNEAIENFIEKGKIIGRTEGRNALMDEIRSIVAACPGRAQTAINAILGGQNAVTVKLIVDAEMAAESAANKRAQEQELEIARLQADRARLTELHNIGGHPGVQMSASVYAPAASAPAAAPSGLEPKAQAELEWDSDPMLRARNGGESGKKHWILYRVHQLQGNVRTLSRAS